MDIHNYKRRFDRALERINESYDISKENKEIIFNFKDYLLSEGIGFAKIERYLIDIIKYSKMLNKSFSKASKEDIRKVIGELNQTKLSEETKKGFKVMLRKLYRFIEGIEEKGVYPERVKWISIRLPSNHRKLPEELLTDKEIMRIIYHCGTLRDKALIATLAESGCRVSEVGTMRIKHISFEKYGARLTVNGKTGMRKILVINCTPYLQEWLNQHPNNDNPESYLWISNDGNLLSYTRIVSIIKNASRKAKIKKRVYLHLLRHSSASKNSLIMSESVMKQYYGWMQESRMAGIYIHLSGKETDEAILRANGIEIKKEKIEPIMKSKKCLRCKTINEATNKFCKLCGLVLDEKTAFEILKEDLERKKLEESISEMIKIVEEYKSKNK